LKIDLLTFVDTAYKNVTIEAGSYQHDGSLALRALTEDGEPLAVLTAYSPYVKPEEGCIFLKSYSENAGLLETLTGLGLVKPTGRFVEMGFVQVPEVRLIGDLKAFCEKAVDEVRA